MLNSGEVSLGPPSAPPVSEKRNNLERDRVPRAREVAGREPTIVQVQRICFRGGPKWLRNWTTPDGSSCRLLGGAQRNVAFAVES